MDRETTQRTEQILSDLERHRETACAGCRTILCGHHVLASIVLGFQDRPLCLPCLAGRVNRSLDVLRDEVVAYIHSRSCFRQGWAWSSMRERIHPEAMPECLHGAAPTLLQIKENTMNDPTPVAHQEWDAADIGCGDLVLQLRIRLQSMPPGHILKVTARDPGAPEDLPAWCRLTGHTLVRAEHPTYWIKRKE